MAKHRKMHLYDIDIPGKITFQESETLSPGNSLTTVDTGNNIKHHVLYISYTHAHTDWCKVGIGICYDVTFPELAQLYAKKGKSHFCNTVFIPIELQVFISCKWLLLRHLYKPFLHFT